MCNSFGRKDEGDVIGSLTKRGFHMLGWFDIATENVQL